jgi:outer membrane receptor protein involved in Fe transport
VDRGGPPDLDVGRRFEWLAGFFYTNEEALNGQLVFALDQNLAPIPPLDPLAIVAIPSTYEEYALFGNATFRLTDRFWISGGLRWAHNDQTFRQVSSGAIVPPADRPGESSEDVWTFSVSPQYHFTDDTMVYARVATGYRPGGPNVVVPGLPATVDADTLVNYELGLKTRLADPALSLDIALFRMDWDDIQVRSSPAASAASAMAEPRAARGSRRPSSSNPPRVSSSARTAPGPIPS